MASSSKNINMPLMFAITIGATVSLLATTMFGLAWYEYEARRTLTKQVLFDEAGDPAPTHSDAYDRIKQEQLNNLGDINAAIIAVAAANVKDQPSEPDAQAGQDEAAK